MNRLDDWSAGSVQEHGHTGKSGHQIAQKFQSLCGQLPGKKVDARQVAARPGEAQRPGQS